MAGPLAGISAAQIAQQKLQDQGAAQLKQGPSKFDSALKAKAPQAVQAPQATQSVQAAQAAQRAEQVRQVESVGKADRVALNKVHGAANDKATARGADPVTQMSEVSKGTSSMAAMLSEIEKGQSTVDKLIKAGISGKNFSHSEMLALQASVYRYTQELELTGKVVEKATTGLKDTLKTQV